MKMLESDSEFIKLFILLGVEGWNALEFEHMGFTYAFIRFESKWGPITVRESDSAFLKRIVSELRRAEAVRKVIGPKGRGQAENAL